ncbi:MAG TPA: dienelactone hydrolase family protein [Steroidobacteraceae bacterium]|jgi:carboxymethylenebutenolidase|nr:dienelactone hydrolase family protein [Steroidobacteraceae bacterium]
MCENDDFDAIVQYQRRGPALSRREFGALSVGAGLLSLVPAGAYAAATSGADVDITTPDGTCDAYFVHPTKGKHPAVLIWPDIFGLRPAFKQMATRLAESGYSVLVINPFYRIQKAPTSTTTTFDATTRAALTKMMGSLSPKTAQVDGAALVPWLDKQASVDRKKKMGTTGYCMGGPYTFRLAAQFPERVGAIATFHGAALANASPDSPHLLVPKMKASALICIAASDDMSDPKAKDLLETAFTAAGLPHEVQVYEGTKHGWCPTDSGVYDHDAAEKAWSRLLFWFNKSLV